MQEEANVKAAAAPGTPFAAPGAGLPPIVIGLLAHHTDNPQSRCAAPLAACSIPEPWAATVWDTLKLFSLQLGTLGGSSAIAKTAVAPLERVKVLLQVQAMSITRADQQYRGLLDAVRRISRQEGRPALWRGNGTNVIRIAPEVALRFALHDQLLTMFSPTDGTPLGFSGKLAAGAAAGILRTVVCYPWDLAATRLAADVYPLPSKPAYIYHGLSHCLSHTLLHEGFRGLYKGVLMSGLGASCHIAASFTAYDEMNRRLPRDRPTCSTWWFPAAKIATGAAAGLVGQAACYPVDTVRRRMQLNGAPGQLIKYTSYGECVRSMAAHEGLTSFYRGIGVACIKTVPAAAMHFLAFDLLKSAVLYSDPSLVSSNF